ncbi:MAG: aldo/keto reductase, partial [Gemmatimonadaceae bacterium]
PAHSRATNPEMNHFMGPDLMNDKVLSAVPKLEPTARSLALSMAQLALAWVLRQQNVAAAIIGASKPEQVSDNAGASGVKLSDDVLRQIDEIILPVAHA